MQGLDLPNSNLPGTPWPGFEPGHKGSLLLFDNDSAYGTALITLHRGAATNSPGLGTLLPRDGEARKSARGLLCGVSFLNWVT